MKPLLQKEGHKQHQDNKTNWSPERDIISLIFYMFLSVFFLFKGGFLLKVLFLLSDLLPIPGGSRGTQESFASLKAAVAD